MIQWSEKSKLSTERNYYSNGMASNNNMTSNKRASEDIASNVMTSNSNMTFNYMASNKMAL